ncbi:hypothetical protein R6Q59_019552 [Mikania micrantha]
MGKISYMKLKGSQNLRQRLLLSTLSSTPILIEDIRADATWPGLLSHEVSFLRLLETVSDDCHVEINETGTKLKYKPGIVMGGRYLEHDCGLSRSIGYFLEPLIVLGLFGKKPLSIKLKGITNDSKDPSVDTFRSTTLPLLKRFGVPSEGSPGYGISLIAETTSGCFISVDTTISYPRENDDMDIDEKKELMPPEEVGEEIASLLLAEIEQGGVVDSTHQGLLFLLCALCPQDVSKVRVGKLVPYGIQTLRNIRDFLGVKFVIKPEPSTGTVMLKCIGCGLKNFSRKLS